MNIQKIKINNVSHIQPIKVSNAQSININMKTQEKNVIPTKKVQSIKPDIGYNALSEVVVESIPDNYIEPIGIKKINTNGIHNIKEYENAEVDVQPSLQEKKVYVKPDDNNYIMPDEDYYGLAYVNVIGAVDTENVEVTPTKETQTINRSEDKYIESVKVNAIPDEYITPSGELEITENGQYDVKDKASVNVEIASSGGSADISEYFNINPETFVGSSSSPFILNNYFLKMPDLVIPNDVKTLSYVLSYSNGDTQYNLNIAPKIIFNNNVTSLYYAFCHLKKDINLDLSGCNTENVTNMSYSFAYSNGLTKLDLSNWKTNSVTTMYQCFYNCSGLTSLILNGWNVENLTNMYQCFASCSGLTSLDLSSFYTPKLTNTAQTFSNCVNLLHLDIRNFDFTKVTSYTNMFGSSASNGLPNDCLIIVKDETSKTWITDKFNRLTNVKTVAEYETQ